MIPPKSLKTLLYVFSRKKEDPDVLPLSPLFRDALIVSNVPKRSVVRRKKEEVKSPCPLLLCPILDYVVKGNYMVLLGIARY